jgi:Type IV secretion system pilin
MRKILLLNSFLLIGILFGGQSALAAITSAECTAKGTGAYCGTSFGGDGCYDSEKVEDQCTGGRGGTITGPCCVPYTTLCSKGNGTVRSPANTCRTGETMLFTWDSGSTAHACCVTGGGTATPPTGGTATPPTGGATTTPPPTSSATCTAISGAVCAAVSAGCPTGKTARGTCGNQGNCCVPTTPTTGGGAATPSAPVTIEITNPLEYDTVESLLDQVMGTLRNIVVILALVFLVIGGLLYITSAGNDKRINAAKAAITAALVGLAIVMIAPSFLKEIGGVLGWTDLPSQASGALSLTQIATNVLNFLLGIIGILAIIMFLVGAVMYLTSAGDDKKAGTAKDIVKYAIIGMIVTFSALVIVRQIADFFIAT